MKRRMQTSRKAKDIKIKDTPKVMSMTGASVEPWMKKAKKPEPDAKPKHPGSRSANKNVDHSKRTAKLTGLKL